MTNLVDKKVTLDTYNKTAQLQANKFNKLGARVEDIAQTFSLIDKNNPKVLELGCGNGRDAEEIVKRTNDYLGVDISSELIKIARESVPEAKFKVADFEEFKFPENIDVIFAFASLLHSDKKSVREILRKASRALNNRGVFYISTKYGCYKRKNIDKEGHGPKIYYFYNIETFEKIIPETLKVVFREIEEFKGQKWLELVLQKV